MPILILLCCFLNSWADFELGPSAAINKWTGKAQVVQAGTDGEYLSVETTGNGTPNLVFWEFKEPVDMEKHFVQAYIHINSLETWQSIELRLSDDLNLDSYFAVPIRKFSDPNFNWIIPGQWLRVTLTLGEASAKGTPDIHKIKYLSWYINDTGSETQRVPSFVVSLSGVGLVSTKSQPLLSITFDDGHQANMAAAETMFQYGLRGTAYIIPNYIGKKIDGDQYLSQDELNKLSKKYRWGISAHHEQAFDSFSPGRLHAESESILNYLSSNDFEFSAPHLAYPLGKVDANVLNIASHFFRTGRVASGGAETLPPADWRRLRVVNITPEMTAEKLEERIKKAQVHNEWLILMFHRLTDKVPQHDLEFNNQEFRKIVEVIHKSKITTLPVNEVWEAHRVD